MLGATIVSLILSLVLLGLLNQHIAPDVFEGLGVPHIPTMVERMQQGRLKGTERFPSLGRDAAILLVWSLCAVGIGLRIGWVSWKVFDEIR